MSKGILRSFYNGSIIPWERPNPHSRQQLLLLQKIEAEGQYLKTRLSPEDYERFQQLSHLQTELTMADEENLFSYAFSLGVLLAMEVAEEKNTLLNSHSTHR